MGDFLQSTLGLTLHSGMFGVAVQLTTHYGALGVCLQSMTLHCSSSGVLVQSTPPPSGTCTIHDVPLKMTVVSAFPVYEINNGVSDSQYSL